MPLSPDLYEIGPGAGATAHRASQNPNHQEEVPMNSVRILDRIKAGDLFQAEE